MPTSSLRKIIRGGRMRLANGAGAQVACKDMRWAYWILGLLALSSVGGAIYLLWLDYPSSADEWGDAGQKGDYWGGHLAATTGLVSAVLFMIAIILQREELRLQREELRLQRKETAATRLEIQGQREQMEAQSRTLQRQNFESTFFQLMTLWNEQIRGITWQGNHGKAAISALWQLFVPLAVKHPDIVSPHAPEGTLAVKPLQELYRLFVTSYGDPLGEYFRGLSYVLNLIVNNAPSQKPFYMGIVRAQLTMPELQWLFYHSLGGEGSETFRALVEEYQMLQDIPDNRLLAAWHRKFYDPAAFVKMSHAASSAG